MFDPNNPFIGAFDINGTPVVAPTSPSSPLGQELLQRIAQGAVEMSEQGGLSGRSNISFAAITARLEGMQEIARIYNRAMEKLDHLDDRVAITFANGTPAERDAALIQLFAHHHHPEFGDSNAQAYAEPALACRLFCDELTPFLSHTPVIWYLLGPKRHQPRRDECWHGGTLNPNPETGHAVLEYGGRIISLCERQFDHAASYPYFHPSIDEYLKGWHFATPSFDLFRNQLEQPAEDRLHGIVVIEPRSELAP